MAACNQTAPADQGEQPQQEIASADEAVRNNSEESLRLMKLNCYACHNPKSTSHDNIIAPPLVATKYRYKKSYPEREDFIQNMTAFIANPTKENALMRGPVKRFGVMPEYNKQA
jgi:hypothetical protein